MWDHFIPLSCVETPTEFGNSSSETLCGEAGAEVTHGKGAPGMDVFGASPGGSSPDTRTPVNHSEAALAAAQSNASPGAVVYEYDPEYIERK